MQLVLRFCAGGTLIAVLPVVASKASPRIAGIMAMVPAVTLFGFAFLGQDQGILAVGEAARGSLIGLVAVGAFLLTVAAMSAEGRNIAAVLALGVLSWLAVAVVIMFGTSKKGTK